MAATRLRRLEAGLVGFPGAQPFFTAADMQSKQAFIRMGNDPNTLVTQNWVPRVEIK